MRNHIAILIIGSLAFGLLVAGCGGGDDSADAEQIDKATFVKEAERICKQASGKLAAEVTSITKRESTPSSFSSGRTQIVLVKEGLIPSLEEELQQIRALGLPDEAKKDAKAFLEAYQQAIDKTKANPKVGVSSVAPYEGVELAGTKLGIADCPIATVAPSPVGTEN